MAPDRRLDDSLGGCQRAIGVSVKPPDEDIRIDEARAVREEDLSGPPLASLPQRCEHLLNAS
jgi:hypothetical protein